MNSLIKPEDMPEILGLRVPFKFYRILQSPAPLAGMSCPSSSTPWEKINALGFQHVVCLTETNPHYDPAPLNLIHATELEDFIRHRPTPRNPKEEQLIQEAVHIAREKLIAGEGVVVHCAGGTGRTGTVLGCLLRTLGYSYSEVSTYLEKLNKAGGKGKGWPVFNEDGWPESIWQAQLVERFQCDE